MLRYSIGGLVVVGRAILNELNKSLCQSRFVILPGCKANVWPADVPFLTPRSGFTQPAGCCYSAGTDSTDRVCL